MNRSEQEVRLQNPRDFTVQIRNGQTGDIVGTGIVVSTDGKIVTCSHVLRDAGVDNSDQGEAEVVVYFPQARVHNEDQKERRATVVASLPQHAEDIVLLQLIDGPSPLDHRQIAILGTAQSSDGHQFRSFGYRRLSDYQGLPANGNIVGGCERPPGKSLQADPVMLSSQHIDSGMSGAGVLDIEKNLVVGVIHETWETLGDPSDRDTSFAIDAQVLAFNPFDLHVNPEPLSKRVAYRTKTDIEEEYLPAPSRLGICWNNAPGSLSEWVGRDELLAGISADWENPKLTITALIGFAGEGKTSLVRQWTDNLLREGVHTQPDGLFWWGFYERPNVDEFFEAALEYISSGRLHPYRVLSGYSRAQTIVNMLRRGRYIFVLDGLEVVQYKKGDQFGLLRSDDLRSFIDYFATSRHESFCLITSRIPIIDLVQYTTFSHRGVSRMSTSEGRALFYKAGVSGPQQKIDEVVEKWDGYPIVLNILAKDCIDRHGGDIASMQEIPYAKAEEPRYNKLDSLLQQYDGHLDSAERSFLMLFSAFRTDVRYSAFEKVFRADFGAEALNAPIIGLDDARFNKMLNRLLAYSLIRHDQHSERYHMHPLIREYYHSQLIASKETEAKLIHYKIKDYYLQISESADRPSNIKELSPYIEAVHHVCCAGQYDEGERILWRHIFRGEEFRTNYLLTMQLGAFETSLEVLKEFFPNGDTSEEPMLSSPDQRRWFLNEVGFTQMSFGRLSEALDIFKRSKEMALSGPFPDYQNACLTSQNMAELFAYLGDIFSSESVAQEALSVAVQRGNEYDQMQAMAHIAWAAYLNGDLEKAGDFFKAAEMVGGAAVTELTHTYNRGIYYADYLLRIGELDRASQITKGNLSVLGVERRLPQISQCFRILGDIDSLRGDHSRARHSYNHALRIARGITYRPALIEALLARGRWMGRVLGDPHPALEDLNEALAYATEGGFLIYEVDIRIASSWALLALEIIDSALAEGERAKRMSVEMQYYWGKTGAEEVLPKIKMRRGHLF